MGLVGAEGGQIGEEAGPAGAQGGLVGAQGGLAGTQGGLAGAQGGLVKAQGGPADPVHVPSWLLEPAAVAAFERDGFVIAEGLIDAELAQHLTERLEAVLAHEYNVPGGKPDKAPPPRADPRRKPGKQPPPLGGPSKRTIQVVNVWKADASFARLVRSPELGRAVATLAGWEGARIANDQVWAKPPGGAPLAFHRDAPYFDFSPPHVVTVWIALDDMDAELGPLEYAVTSPSPPPYPSPPTRNPTYPPPTPPLDPHHHPTYPPT